MNFCWITLSVKNIEESIEFYKGILGLEVLERFSPHEGKQIAMLGKIDGTKVELICDSNIKTAVQSEGISLGFEVESLDKAMELINNKNIQIKRGPISPIPSVKFFFIDDPNGIEIQIVENIK